MRRSRFWERRGTASLHHRNRTEITVLVRELKPYLVRFLCWCKCYQVIVPEHSLKLSAEVPLNLDTNIHFNHLLRTRSNDDKFQKGRDREGQKSIGWYVNALSYVVLQPWDKTRSRSWHFQKLIHCSQKCLPNSRLTLMNFNVGIKSDVQGHVFSLSELTST